MFSFIMEPNLILTIIVLLTSVAILFLLYFNLRKLESGETTVTVDDVFPEDEGDVPEQPAPSAGVVPDPAVLARLEALEKKLDDLSVSLESAGDRHSDEISELGRKLASFIEPVKEDRALLVGVINEKISVLEIKFENFLSRLERSSGQPSQGDGA